MKGRYSSFTFWSQIDFVKPEKRNNDTKGCLSMGNLTLRGKEQRLGPALAKDRAGAGTHGSAPHFEFARDRVSVN